MSEREVLLTEICRLDARKKLFGLGIQQSWSALFLINKIVSEDPSITRMVELGTLSGGFSLLMGMMLRDRGGKVLTFDLKYNPAPDILEAFSIFSVTFRKGDIWSPECVKLVKEFIKDERALVFCDNGKKSKEFPFYAKLIKPGDIIMAHDWMIEIFPQHLDDETLSILEPFHQRSFNALTTRILSMRKCADADLHRAAHSRRLLHSS